MTDAAIHHVAETVTFTYKNHRGEIAVRHVRPSRFFYGRTEWHAEEWQWLCHAYDIDKKDYRTFAMKDISDWKPYHGN